MSKQYLAALASILFGAGVVFGQAPDSRPASGPEPVAVPSGTVWDGFKLPCLWDDSGKEFAVITADADLVIFFLLSPRTALPLGSTDILSSTTANVVASVDGPEHKGVAIAGSRLALGYWQVEPNPWIPQGIRDLGVETVFFFVGQKSIDFRDTTTPNLIRPFFDLNNRVESGFLVASPGIATGGVAAHGQIDVWGGEANVWKNVHCDYPGTQCSVDVMAGFRFLDMDSRVQAESISVFNSTIASTSPFASFAGNQLDVRDSFQTHNHFYGGQIGIDGKWWIHPKIEVDGDFKLAVGVTHEELGIVGNQVRTFADGTTAVSTGGLLALPSNIGNFHRDKFAIAPELDVKILFPITNYVTLTTGFSALFWDRVARAGTQIDRTIDISQIPNFPPAATATPTGLGHPGVNFVQSDLWVLGLTFGLEFKW
jgi:hypothetical protein